MEISSYTIDSLTQKLIPGKLSGIIFSDAFEELYKMMTGNIMVKNADAEYRTRFLRSLRLMTEMDTDYFYQQDGINCKYPVLYGERDGLMIFFEDTMLAMRNEGDPFCPIPMWNVIKEGNKPNIRIMMRVITALLADYFKMHYDNYSIDSQIEEVTCPENADYYEKEQIDSANQYLKRCEDINSLLNRKNLINYNFDKTLEDVKRSDPKAYKIYKDYKRSIESIESEFIIIPFRPIDDEYNNGAMDINMLLFKFVDEENSFWSNCLEDDFEMADSSGITNTMTWFSLNYTSLDQDEVGFEFLTMEEVLRNVRLFEKIRDFYYKIEKYLNDETN